VVDMSGDGASSALRQDAEKEGKRRCVETIHGGTTPRSGGQHRLWFTEYISSQQAWPTALVSNPALTNGVIRLDSDEMPHPQANRGKA